MSQFSVSNKSALLAGLTGLSQAIEWNRMSGHPPAAVIAAYFFCQENQLENDVPDQVQRLIDLLVSGSESIWYRDNGQPVTNAALFNAEVDGEPDESLIPEIASALEGSLTACRDSGHNTIFASLALKALRHSPEYALPSLVNGIVQLITDFEDRGPGVGHVPGQTKLIDPRNLPPPEGLDLPAYQNTGDMIAAVLRHVLPDHLNKRGLGGPIHLVNHAAALLDLETLGYDNLVAHGLPAHHQHLDLWLRLPSFPAAENTYRPPNPLDPRTNAYWAEGIQLKDRGGYEHRIKFLYGAYRLAAHIANPADRREFLTNAAYLY